ncbi:MAG: cobalamin biosynthesis protein [Christensenellales bacterium]
MLTTATDVRGVPAIDSWAMKNGCAIENKAAIQAVSAAALAGKSVGVAITEREIRPPFPVTLFLRPRTLTLGVGCKRGTDAAHLEDCFRAFLHENGVSPLSVRAVATIDVKKDEAAILALCEKYRFPLQTYSAAELNAVPGVFAHSDFVMKTVGCGCVCERAAVLASGGRLLVGKTAMEGVTLALAGEEDV